MRRPHPIQWLRTHPRAADLLLAALVTFLSVGSYAFADTDGIRDPTWWGFPLAFGAALPLVWRRRAPIAVLSIIVPFQFAIDYFEFGGGGLGTLVALYTVAAHVSTPKSIRVAGAYIAAVLAFIGLGLVTGRPLWGALISSGVLLVAAAALGDNMRRRRERLDWLTERAERAERERDLLARERVNEERARIARELHDVVAHSVSVMVIQAGAARRQLAADPERARTALTTIEETGRDAMNEMRRILGVLRHEEVNELAPVPQLADLPALLDAAEELPARLDTSGELASLPASTQLAAYRTVQEALTNVRRHAGSVRDVSVLVSNDGSRLTVEVRDDGRGASANRDGSGYGLIGMRERVEAAAGTLSAGPRPGGGWRVSAVFALDRAMAR